MTRPLPRPVPNPDPLVRNVPAIGAVVRNYRAENAMPINDAADLLGVSKDVLSRLENGRPIGLDKLFLVLDGFGLTLLIVPKRDAEALAEKIVWAMDHPADRTRLGAAARMTGQQFGIDAFVHKMERLYVLLHDVSRATHRRGVLRADLSFLTSGTSV